MSIVIHCYKIHCNMRRRYLELMSKTAHLYAKHGCLRDDIVDENPQIEALWREFGSIIGAEKNPPVKNKCELRMKGRKMKIRHPLSAAIHCFFWEDFVRFSKGAEIIIYEINKPDAVFRVYAIKENVFVYEELLPPEKTEIVEDKRRRWVKAHKHASNLTQQNKFTIISRQLVTKTLMCGFSYSVTPRLIREGNQWIAEFEYKFDPSNVTEFLSRTLEAPIDRIVEGNLLKIFR